MGWITYLLIRCCTFRPLHASLFPRVLYRVNIETDLIGKYIEKFLSDEHSTLQDKRASGLNFETLLRNEFDQ